jgi:FixJ family two-component response regulator
MSGFDLEAYLSDAGIHFPIVFITAHDDTALRERIEATGHAYLGKPSESALLDAINRVMTSHETHRPDDETGCFAASRDGGFRLESHCHRDWPRAGRAWRSSGRG